MSKKRTTSKDIRSYFGHVITSDEDENGSPSKKSKKPSREANKKATKGHSKKRVISSDEDEKTEVVFTKPNKKPKIEEKELEVVDVEEVFAKQPVKRVNAPKVGKKEEPKKPQDTLKLKFDDDDDYFEATLNQLDTSQIEDEYLSVVNGEKSDFFKEDSKEKKDKMEENGKGLSVLKSKEVFPKKSPDERGKASPKKSNDKSEKASPTKSNDKKDKVSPKKVHDHKEKSSPKKNGTVKNDKHEEKKQESEKEKKKKNTHHSKLEVEVTKARKPDKHKGNDSEDNNEIIEEKIEKKKQQAMLYQNYLNRGGAKNPGSKEVPKAAENCLENLSFLITGVLDSLEREEAEGIIKQYGGKIVHSVSKKLSYLIVGDQAGPSKMSKAESIGVKMISEDDFLDLLRKNPPQNKESDTSNKRKRDSSEEKMSSNKEKGNQQDSLSKEKRKTPEKVKTTNEKDEQKNHASSSKSENIEKDKCKNLELPQKKKESPEVNKNSKPAAPIIEEQIKSTKAPINNVTNINNGVDHITALVEKYRPKNMKQIIGQTGDKSNANKLHFWLKNWHKNHGKNSVTNKSKFINRQRDDTGQIFKAALLSGPPGIGKTTTAYVVCADLGFEVIEFNASDTRSKKLLQGEISGILKNRTVKSYFSYQEKAKETPKHVLLMDEVDGMAGNEDRGGIQELISFIKSTEIPIICICNDRHCQKIKTLANYTFDLRFQIPRLEQIRGAMMSVCFKEGIKVTPDELTQIIQSTNQDIRQVMNHIAVLSAKSTSTNSENKKIEKFKNLKLGPWTVVRKVFALEENKHMNIHEKSDLFFHDYNIAPLFVEENYLNVTPAGPKTEVLGKVAKCSDSLATGDVIEKMIRSSQSWSLLPVQACFSSVIPGSVMSGFINSQINFPSWLGKNSKLGKCDRLLQDITVHARTITGASKEAVNLDYLKMLVDSIVRPLVVEGSEGVERAIEVMNSYHLTREDLDSMIELTKWPHTRDPMASLDTKTKTAFTKAYNKTAMFFSTNTMKKKSTRDNYSEDFIEDEEETVDSGNENEDEEKIENDKLIKPSVSKAKKAPSETKAKGKKTANKNPSRNKK